jgi:hypothetical protein
MQVIAWLVAAMFAWAPPLGSRETERARYTEIATDLVAVVYDPTEQPLFYGDDGRAKTALVLASIAAHESTFRVEVDQGRKRGDSGNSWCLMQMHVGAGKTVEGWAGEDLVKDRRKCFAAGLHIAQWSFHSCKAFPLDERLSAYASGHCGRVVESRQMISRAIAYVQHHPMNDQHLVYVERNSAWSWLEDDRDPVTRND